MFQSRKPTTIALYMAYQAGSGQPWPHVRFRPSDGDDQPLMSQLLDIGNPLDLSRSLNSLDASWSDLHSSNQESTVLTPTSDILFGSGKPDLIKGNASFNTSAKKPSNPMSGNVVSASASAPGLHSIDPRLLLRGQALGEDMNPSACHPQSSRFLLSVNARSEAGGDLPNQMSCPNDSALTPQEAETAPNTTELNPNTISYLTLWMLLNPDRLPSTANLKSIENLSHAPGKSKVMMNWLKNQVTVTSENNTSTNPRLAKLLQRGDEAQQYHPKCVSSRQRKIQPSKPKPFACTNRCGQTFHRKEEWARHEQINFEEWACYVCTKGLTRKEHLRTHLKDRHNIQGIPLEKYKRELLASIDRPCGFCGKGFSSWWEWLAHVGAHFERSRRGKVWKISKWKERGPAASQSNARPDLSYASSDSGDIDQNQYSDDGSGGNNDGSGGNNGGNGVRPAYSMQDTGSGCKLGSRPALPNQTSNHYQAYTVPQECASQQEGVPQQAPKEAATINHSLDHIPYGSPDDDQENDHDFIPNVICESTHDPAHRMASLYFSKMGNQQESLHDTTATEYSCSSADCTKRLYFEIPAVPTDPHARNGGGCHRLGGPIYSPVQRYLSTPPYEDPFSVCRLTQSTPLPTRLQPILIKIEELPPVSLRSVL